MTAAHVNLNEKKYFHYFYCFPLSFNFVNSYFCIFDDWALTYLFIMFFFFLHSFIYGYKNYLFFYFTCMFIYSTKIKKNTSFWLIGLVDSMEATLTFKKYKKIKIKSKDKYTYYLDCIVDMILNLIHLTILYFFFGRIHCR